MKVKNCGNCAYSIQGKELLNDQRICMKTNIRVDVDHYCDSHQHNDEIRVKTNTDDRWLGSPISDVKTMV